MVTITTKMGSSSLLLLLFSFQSLALTPDPSGQSKVGNGQHQSSIGSQCLSSLDCGANGNTACCAFLPQAGGATIGICSGCGATTQAGKQGCGFGDQGKDIVGQPQVCPASSFAQGSAAAGSVNATGATGAPASAAAPAIFASASSSNCNTRRRSSKHEQRQAAQQPPILQRQSTQLPDPTLNAGAGNGKNAQFITGQCVNASDCGASQTDLSKVCCASVVDQATGQTVGVCSGSAVGNAAPKLGCGFGDGLANSALAKPAGAMAVSSSETSCGNTGAASANAAAAAPLASASPPITQAQPAQLPDPNLDAGKGNQQNKQFVTGACINSKDCGAEQANLANVCCASVMSGGQVVGVCSGSAVGNTAPKMGCGFGNGKINSAA